MAIKDDGVHVSKSARQSSAFNINNISGLYIGEVTENSDALYTCLLYTSPSPRDSSPSRMPSSA